MAPQDCTPVHPHFPAKAKHVIYLFLNGGPSQVDTFDPKPMLTKYHGKPVPGGNLKTERKTGNLLVAVQFKQCGKSGLEVSEIFPKLGEHADDLCVIRSMHTERPNHEPSLFMMNTRPQLPGPSVDGLLAHLRAGNGESESAGLRRAVPGPSGDRAAAVDSTHICRASTRACICRTTRASRRS